MPYLPNLPGSSQTRQVLEVFSGYNHNLKIGDGEFYHTQNLCADHYPMLSVRKKRGVVRLLQNPQGMLAKGALAYVENGQLYYGEENITSYLQAKGLALSPEGEKTMVGMGAYLLIFPDKVYINTTDFSDCGAMEAYAQTSGHIEYTICEENGNAYPAPYQGAQQPSDPQNGDLWLDTSGSAHVLKVWSEAASQWTQIPTVYTKISAAGIGLPFEKYDGVTISGCAGSPQAEALNGSRLIQEKGDDYIVVAGLLDQSYIQTEGTVTVKRSVPDMDFVTECQNRLWGCKYGLAEGKTVNEIYCCALGDFKNWSKYQGISTDSYTASVGSDGPFTGAVTFMGNPLFFKENRLHKVYVSPGGAHQIVDTAMPGVMKGSEKSLCPVGNQLFYLSRDGVCAYTGSTPTVISRKLGSVFCRDGVAGAYGSRYYISVSDGENRHLFRADTDTGVWYREDDLEAIAFASLPGELYCLASDGRLLAMNGTKGTPESSVAWSGETGLMGYGDADRKYVSRLNLRMILPVGSTARVEIQYDSDGIWHEAGTMTGRGTNSFLLPLRPRRCDHFRFRISGTGDMKLYSLARLYESGSDVGNEV